MNEILDLVVRHSYLLIFAFVFAEQVGLPLPALPILLAAGALARLEAVDPGLAFAVAVAASVLSDLEASSARVALLLRRKGVRKVRPLAGGLPAWQALTAERPPTT